MATQAPKVRHIRIHGLLYNVPFIDPVIQYDWLRKRQTKVTPHQNSGTL